MSKHEHQPTVVWTVTYDTPPVPGARTRQFKYISCGAEGGCGAVFIKDEWFAPEAVETT